MHSELAALIAAASAGHTPADPCTCEERSVCKCDPHEGFMCFLFHLGKMLELTHESGFTNFDVWSYDNAMFRQLRGAYSRCLPGPRRRRPAVETLLTVADKLGYLGEAVNSYRESEKTFVAGLQLTPEALVEQYQRVYRELRLMCTILDEIFAPGGGLAGAVCIELIDLGKREGGTNDDPDNIHSAKRVRPWTPL